MPQPAAHIPAVPESGTRRIYELALTLDDPLMLVVGEPDDAVPEHVREAARAAWSRDDTDYAPNGGIPALRRAIVEKLARENGFEADVDQVWVTVGGTQAIAQALTIALGAGDEVLVPDPGYTTFTMYPRSIGAVPVPYPLRAEDGFVPRLPQLERLVTERTRAIIVNSPSNPLGVVFDEATLEELVAFAARHDLWIVSDEVYEHFTWSGPHVSVAAVAARTGDQERVLSVFSTSKSHAMTGARVGWLVTPPGFGGTMRALQEATIACVATPDQHAAVAALTGGDAHIRAARDRYRAHIELAAALLDARGFRYHRPEGAFYLWIDVSHASEGDVAGWAQRFLLEARVAVAPGTAFGRAGEGWIRICLAAAPEVVRTAIERLPSPRHEPAGARE
ncbi:aminotransferase class I/II-fold pyridoxal phosphate-dependent enzyme [Microbacterium betulae]|uniref:Aminotransferase n=1 Tax=Microbacterium betulae TaxID=2981139 RepID=A0AA97I8D6_9MICO|nr:aminotransferase class I/II-fold pyridoxal phosphate-dependent enzyme [Microbacterium sp. AB]WOF24542.1 aminotransferase class I/II-fold pyridoxal phosphate-dependent enzyme [Microbacterium sp. AB]